MKTIPTNNSNLVAIVDDDDFERLSKHVWRIIPKNRVARGYIDGNRKIGRIWRTVYMSRDVMHVTDGRVVDHINHDKLDNRKSNLRPITYQQNSFNMSVSARKKPGSHSQFKGISRDRDRRLWQCGIMINYKRIALGRFESEIDAAKAYDAAARKYFGEFACLNFPDQS